MKGRIICLILLIGGLHSFSRAQSNYARTQEFFVDFSDSERLVIPWGMDNEEDVVPTFNPFDSLEIVKAQTDQLLKELESAFEVQQYQSSKIIIETLQRLEYRMGLIELSINAIEERLRN